MKPEHTEPRLFKLLDDFMIAEKMMKKCDAVGKKDIFYQKIKASFLQIDELINIELDKMVQEVTDRGDLPIDDE
jgi:hypothetical protein